MSDRLLSNVERFSNWQLVADFTASRLPNGEQQMQQVVARAMHRFNLKATQLNGMCEALARAVSRVKRSEQGIEPTFPVRCRIWVSGADEKSRGWGFFFVDREAESGDAEGGHLVELFLYQEIDS